MASNQSQRKRAYDGRRWKLVVERALDARQSSQDARRHLADALRLIESADFQVRCQPNAGMMRKYGDEALAKLDSVVGELTTTLEWAEEGLWIHDQEKAERVARWVGRT